MCVKNSDTQRSTGGRSCEVTPVDDIIESPLLRWFIWKRLKTSLDDALTTSVKWRPTSITGIIKLLSKSVDGRAASAFSFLEQRYCPDWACLSRTFRSWYGNLKWRDRQLPLQDTDVTDVEDVIFGPPAHLSNILQQWIFHLAFGTLSLFRLLMPGPDYQALIKPELRRYRDVCTTSIAML